MSDNGVMVVIPKELRDQIVSDYKWSEMNPELQEALRAAPETVSLDGVEQIIKDAWNAGWASAKRDKGTPNLYWIRVAQELDLRRLVAPVQPSAVDIPCGKYAIPGLDGTVWKCGSKPASAKGKIILCDDCFGKLELWGKQLPKPQTVGRLDLSGVKRYKIDDPDTWSDFEVTLSEDTDGEWVAFSDLTTAQNTVQGGGVDFSNIRSVLEELWSSGYGYSSAYHDPDDRCYRDTDAESKERKNDDVNEALSHLQQAPQSAPEVKP